MLTDTDDAEVAEDIVDEQPIEAYLYDAGSGMIITVCVGCKIAYINYVLRLGNYMEAVKGVPEPFLDYDEDDVNRLRFSDDESESDEDESSNISVNEVICNWFHRNPSTTVSSLTDLLSSMKPFFPSLPQDARTLLKISSPSCKPVTGGKMSYMQLEKSLRSVIDQTGIPPNQAMSLKLSYDGMPLFRSSKTQIWPLLCTVEGISMEPFVTAISCGSTKPNIEETLADFLSEYAILSTEGFMYNGNVRILCKLAKVIADAPARALIKCVKPHNAYNSCERCKEEGDWAGRVVYLNEDAPLRTDNDFHEPAVHEHITGHSPLLHYLGMVSGIPLDYMHLFCLGVVRRLLHFLRSGPLLCRQPAGTWTTLSEKIVSLSSFVPDEFSRKPRSLTDMEYFKASEFRALGLYLLPLCSGILPSHLTYFSLPYPSPCWYISPS